MTFRSLETRIVVFFVILLVAVQGTAFVLITATNQNIARREVANQLEVGEREIRGRVGRGPVTADGDALALELVGTGDRGLDHELERQLCGACLSRRRRPAEHGQLHGGDRACLS